MMVMPSDEQRKMTKVLSPWLRQVGESDVPELKEGAPKDVQDMYQIYLQKYVSKF